MWEEITFLSHGKQACERNTLSVFYSLIGGGRKFQEAFLGLTGCRSQHKLNTSLKNFLHSHLLHVGTRLFLQIRSRFKISRLVTLFRGCVSQSCQSKSNWDRLQTYDNTADKWGISYWSGLHQLNEVGLNISAALKPFERHKEKREIPSKTPGLTAPSVERGGRASDQTGI